MAATTASAAWPPFSPVRYGCSTGTSRALFLSRRERKDHGNYRYSRRVALSVWRRRLLLEPQTQVVPCPGQWAPSCRPHSPRSRSWASTAGSSFISSASTRGFAGTRLRVPEPLQLPEPEVARGLAARFRLSRLLARFPERPVWAAFMFVNSFLTIAILAGVAMASGTPFVFPSLGPTAFLFFFTPT